MKVRFLLHNLYGAGGGVLTVTLGLAEALADKHEVELVSVFDAGKPPVHPFPANVAVRSLIRRGRPRSAEEEQAAATPSAYAPKGEPRLDDYSALVDQKVGEFLRETEGGAVVTMQPALNVMLGALGTDRYLKIAQDHRPIVNRPAPLKQAYADNVAGLDAFLTLTRKDARRYQRLFGSGALVRRMSNGTPIYDGELSRLDAKVAVAAGRLKPSKGFDVLVEAWTTVAARHPDWRLHIYGAGPEREALERLVADRRLGGVVELKGFTTDLLDRMAESGLFVLSSRTEGYGMVLVEAMSCGVPVVSTDAPFGPAEIVDDGVDGLLVANEDPAALADGICRMIELPAEERRAFGRAARAKSVERSYPVIAEEWSRLLDEVAQRRGSVTRPAPSSPAAPRAVSAAGAGGRTSSRPASVVLHPATEREEERTYVIFGTRRGGTSMVAGIARALGLDLGDPGKRKNNEDPRFHPAHPRVLRERVAERNQEAAVWGWKYPAAATYLPELHGVLRNPYYVVVYRDPVAAALSQLRLDSADNTRDPGLSLHEATANATMNTGFVLSVDRPCLLISNEAALARPEQVIDDVADFLGVPRPDGELRAKVLDYIKPGQYKSFDDYFAPG